MSLRVFLCDDVPQFRALVRAVLEDEPGVVVVGEAASGPAAVLGVGVARPDVVLLDLDMPGGNGLPALPGIRAQVPDAYVIVLSSSSAAQMERRALEAGADAYLEKRAPLDELAAAVTRRHRGPLAA